MGIDNSTLLRQTSQDLLNGLILEGNVAFADIVCNKLSRASIKGSEPFRASKDTVARPAAKRAIGTAPQPFNANMSSIDWNMHRYGEFMNLDYSEIADINQYMDALGGYTKTLHDIANVAVDNELVTLLTNATYNNSQAAATGTWDLATSTPVLDMQAAAKKVPGSDLVIVGYQSALELAAHPDIKEESSNYSGGGSIGFAALRDKLANLLGVSREAVHIFGTFYDSANPAASLSVTYSAGDLFWIGYKDNLAMVHQPEDVKSWTVDQGESVNFGVSRTLDLIRVDKDTGVYMTGL